MTDASAANRENCMRKLELATARNSKVHKLIDAIQGLGCMIPSDFFLCRPCEGSISGGFAALDQKTSSASSSSSSPLNYQPRIIMCENNMLETETFENTLVHELVHAYDQCRAKIDWSNCIHHACTEVRASALSGECSLLHEIYRNNLTLRKGHQECVKRRAEKSIAMNPHCKSIAADAVSAAFKQCYSDKAPFE